ncbi:MULTISPECIES: MFS transporter [unclassified Modestobacter]
MTAVDRSPGTVGTPPSVLPRGVGWALGSGTVLQGLNSSVIAVALVSIATDFGAAGAGALPWLVSSMYIACAVASPSAGRLVDLFGARRLYLVGLAVVLAAAVAGPFLPSVRWLVADRIVMGIGASVHFPAAMAIVRQMAAERGASGRSALGTIAFCGQAVAAIGPSLGGLLVSAFGWQSIFWVNVPLVAHSALWLLVTIPRSVDVERPGAEPAPGARPRRGVRSVVRALDLPGLGLFVLALVVLMWGLLGLDDVVAGDRTPLLWIAASLPLWALFGVREVRAVSPFVDVRLLAANPQVVRTCGRGVLTFVAFYGVFYGLPQWFESVRGLSPAGAGALMIPVFGMGAVSTALATRAGARLSSRALLVTGGAAFAVAGALLATVMTADTPVWAMVGIGALLGVPNGFNNIGNQAMLQATAPADAIGVASGLYRTSQYIGAALSAAVVTLLVVEGAPRGGIAALGAVIGTIGAVLVLLNAIALVRARRTSVAL